MKCNCIQTSNDKLAEKNLELDTLFVLDPMTTTITLFIATRWKDESKKQRGKKPTKIVVTYCPFCGKKA